MSPILASFFKNPNKYCGSNCSHECNYFSYDTIVTNSQFLTAWYWNYRQHYFSNYKAKSNSSDELAKVSLFRNLSLLSIDQARASMLKLNIYLNDIGYTSVVESPLHTTSSLLSNIGGELGLFVGISMLSLVEIFELAYLVIKNKLNSLKAVNKQ